VHRLPVDVQSGTLSLVRFLTGYWGRAIVLAAKDADGQGRSRDLDDRVQRQEYGRSGALALHPAAAVRDIICAFLDGHWPLALIVTPLAHWYLWRRYALCWQHLGSGFHWEWLLSVVVRGVASASCVCVTLPLAPNRPHGSWKWRVGCLFGHSVCVLMFICARVLWFVAVVVVPCGVEEVGNGSGRCFIIYLYYLLPSLLGYPYPYY